MISKLNKGTAFVCFRESKLTRILQPYLGGNSITAIICTISPLKSNYQETVNTLRFGICAGGIKNDVKVNVKENTRPECIDEMEAILKQTREEETMLQEEVENQKRVIEQNEAEYETKARELEVIYETYLEALKIKKELVSLRTERQQKLEKGRARLVE